MLEREVSRAVYWPGDTFLCFRASQRDIMEQRIDDLELIGRVKAGDIDAYADLVRRHHPAVMSLCMGMLADKAAAEDVAQETFLKAYASLKDFRGDAAFSTWLYRIASNKCLDAGRKISRAKTQSLDSLLEGNNEALQRLAAAPGPERALEDAQLVEQILSCLPDAYRLILTLRELQGLTYEEIAVAMSCTVDSVKARLQRARKEFLDQLRHFAAPENV